MLALVLIFALCACAQTAQQPVQAQPVASDTAAATAQTVVPAATQSAGDASSAASQIELMFKNLNMLKSDTADTQYWYTVTDLDHNGRLELISAVTQGAESVTSGKISEVNSAYNGFDTVNLGLGAGESLPEIITAAAETYKDASNNYSYIFTDSSMDAYGTTCSSKVALSMKNSALSLKKIASKNITMQNGYTIVSFSDANGNRYDDPYSFDYTKAVDNYFKSATKSNTCFDWFSLAEAASSSRLVSSYNVFNGSSQPPTNQPAVNTPAVASPSPTIVIVDIPTPTVTKHPTSENPIVGGQAIFVARADAYQYMTWQLISPSGGVYDLSNSNPFPGMGVSGANNPQLVLSNVPLNLNGWSVRAVFTGTRDTVYSYQAYIYVSDRTTVTVSPSSGYVFSAVNNLIAVYSSNGQSIHVECIQSGNTGAYYSDNVSSGSYIPIEGIAGQVVTVSVYVSSGNAQTTAYYTVDCTPIVPVITPEPYNPPVPTYSPVSTSKSGTVDWLNESGGSYFVGVTFDDGSGGNYDISYMVSNPPSPGDRCTCEFAADGFSLIGFYYG